MRNLRRLFGRKRRNQFAADRNAPIADILSEEKADELVAEVLSKQKREKSHVGLIQKRI